MYRKERLAALWEVCPQLPKDVLEKQVPAVAVGMDLWILPSSAPAKEHCVARLVEIRENEDDAEFARILFRIKWYYTRRQLRLWFVKHKLASRAHKLWLGENFITRLGSKELVLTDHFQILEIGKVLHTGLVHRFTQSSPTQQVIPHDELYYRFVMNMADFVPLLDHEGGQRHDVPLSFLASGPKFGCDLRCGILYSPETDLQRFCRWCEHWFHVECLHAQGMELGPWEKMERLFEARVQFATPVNYPIALSPIERGLGSVTGPVNAIHAEFRRGFAESDGEAWVPDEDIDGPWESFVAYSCPLCGGHYM